MSRIGPHQVVRYIASAGLSFVGNLGVTWALHRLGARPEAAFALAQLTLFITNFYLARHFVFRSAGSPALGQFGGYAATSLTFRLAEYLLFLILHSVFQLHYLLSVALALLTTFTAKFGVYRRYVFR